MQLLFNEMTLGTGTHTVYLSYVLKTSDFSRTHYWEKFLRCKGRNRILEDKTLSVSMIIFYLSSLKSPKYEIKWGYCVQANSSVSSWGATVMQILFLQCLVNVGIESVKNKTNQPNHLGSIPKGMLWLSWKVVYV